MLGGIDYGIKNDHCHRACGIHHRRPDFPESQKPEEVTSQGWPCGAAPFTYPKGNPEYIKEDSLKPSLNVPKIIKNKMTIPIKNNQKSRFSLNIT